MELNELKKIWRQQEKSDEMEYSKSELMVLINNKMLSLEKEIKARDRLEIIAAVIVIGFFGFMFFTANSILTQIGCATIVLSGIYICYKLKSAQIERLNEEQSFDKPMDEHLQFELEQLEQQRSLLQNVAWWYIAPITIGLVFVTIGGESSTLFKTVYLSIVAIFGGFVWWLNQRAVRKKFEPLETEIREAINSIKNGE